MHVKTRRVILSPATFKPDAVWVAAQAEAFVEKARSEGLAVARLMRDRDKMLSKAFDGALRRRRVRVLPTAYQSPNMNAYAERFVQTIKHECLDHFIVFGTQHMNHLCSEFLDHYHTERPHQGCQNELLVDPKMVRRPADDDLPLLGEIHCRARLGGLLKSYSRMAA